MSVHCWITTPPTEDRRYSYTDIGKESAFVGNYKYLDHLALLDFMGRPLKPEHIIALIKLCRHELDDKEYRELVDFLITQIGNNLYLVCE